MSQSLATRSLGRMTRRLLARNLEYKLVVVCWGETFVMPPLLLSLTQRSLSIGEQWRNWVGNKCLRQTNWRQTFTLDSTWTIYRVHIRASSRTTFIIISRRTESLLPKWGFARIYGSTAFGSTNIASLTCSHAAMISQCQPSQRALSMTSIRLPSWACLRSWRLTSWKLTQKFSPCLKNTSKLSSM